MHPPRMTLRLTPMPTVDFVNLLAAQVSDTVWTRLGVLAIGMVAGLLFIAGGINNIQTRQAEETGRRRLVNRIAGRSNTYTGSSAVTIGWVRILCGILAVIFGIVFSITGPVLAGL